jgi:hypothetical protein
LKDSELASVSNSQKHNQQRRRDEGMKAETRP